MLPYTLTTHPWVRAARRPWKVLQAFCACLAFGVPSRKLRVIGITGTTGKTTTIHLTAAALESAGYTVGAVSSIRIHVGTKILKNESGLTSLGPWKLQRLLAYMVRSGCQYAVIEVSSHALDQQRFWGVAFDVAMITNLSRDHLDYHRTVDNYARAKRRLFDAVSRRPRKVLRGVAIPRVLIASLDDPKTLSFLDGSADRKYGVTLLNPSVATPSGTEPVYGLAIHVLPEKTASVVMAEGKNALLHLRLPGIFNVRNSLMAVAAGVSQKIDLARITRALSEIRSIPGRVERVDCGQPFQVIVDYAVTAAALESLFGALRGMHPKRIFAVFGAAGNRDRGKRAEMAAIVARYADVVFLTNEDPFSEDPEQIFADLEEGFRDAKCVKTDLANVPADTVRSCLYVKIPDRREAMREALRRARADDIVVATGKGAEETMRFQDRTIPWSDRAVFEEELRVLFPPTRPENGTQ